MDFESSAWTSLSAIRVDVVLLKGIENFDAGPLKIFDVTCRDDEIVAARNCGDITVFDGHWPNGSLQLMLMVSPVNYLLNEPA